MFPTHSTLTIIIFTALRVAYPQPCHQLPSQRSILDPVGRMLPLSLSVLCYAPSLGGAGQTPAVASRAAVSLITLPWRAKGKKTAIRT